MNSVQSTIVSLDDYEKNVIYIEEEAYWPQREVHVVNVKRTKEEAYQDVYCSDSDLPPLVDSSDSDSEDDSELDDALPPRDVLEPKEVVEETSLPLQGALAGMPLSDQ